MAITDRQAEARRENGKKGRGPATDDGKRRSSANAVKHGVWALQPRPISRGPLREDPDEMNDFYVAVVEELAPGDSLVLRQMATDVAHGMWKEFRVHHWEAYGYATPPSATTQSNRAEMLHNTAIYWRRGAEAVRLLPDPAVSGDDLWHAIWALCELPGIHHEAFDEDTDETSDGESLEILTSLLSQYFEGDSEAAAETILELADDKERECADLYEVDQYNVMRDEIDSDFTKNVMRLTAHTSRELDKSLTRYWRTKEILSAPQPESAGAVRVAEAGTSVRDDADDTSDLASIEALLDLLVRADERQNAKRTYGGSPEDG